MKRKLVLEPDGDTHAVPMPEDINPIPFLWYDTEDEVYDYYIEQKYKPIIQWIRSYISSANNAVISTIPNLQLSAYNWSTERNYFDCSIEDEQYKKHIINYFQKSEYVVILAIRILVGIPVKQKYWDSYTDEYQGSNTFQIQLFRQIPPVNHTTFSRKIQVDILLDELNNESTI